jgi:hypothetical protein
MNDYPSQPNHSTRQGLLLVLIGLTLLTTYQFYNRQPHFELRTTPSATGWGYVVLAGGNPIIDQPIVPGQTGRAGFATQEQAQRAGERVIQKLQQGQQLPTLSGTELRELGVNTP